MNKYDKKIKALEKEIKGKIRAICPTMEKPTRNILTNVIVNLFYYDEDLGLIVQDDNFMSNKEVLESTDSDDENYQNLIDSSISFTDSNIDIDSGESISFTDPNAEFGSNESNSNQQKTDIYWDSYIQNFFDVHIIDQDEYYNFMLKTFDKIYKSNPRLKKHQFIRLANIKFIQKFKDRHLSSKKKVKKSSHKKTSLKIVSDNMKSSTDVFSNSQSQDDDYDKNDVIITESNVMSDTNTICNNLDKSMENGSDKTCSFADDNNYSQFFKDINLGSVSQKIIGRICELAKNSNSSVNHATDIIYARWKTKQKYSNSYFSKNNGDHEYFNVKKLLSDPDVKCYKEIFENCLKCCEKIFTKLQGILCFDTHTIFKDGLTDDQNALLNLILLHEFPKCQVNINNFDQTKIEYKNIMFQIFMTYLKIMNRE